MGWIYPDNNLKNSSLDMKMYPGSTLILVNNRVENLDAPVQVYQGMIIVPESFVRFFAEEKKSAPPPQRKGGGYSIKKIVIDAGHGGKDPGAVGFGVQEKDVNLDIAKRLKSELEKSGVQVLLTRETDIFHPLQKRADIANAAHADFSSVFTPMPLQPRALPGLRLITCRPSMMTFPRRFKSGKMPYSHLRIQRRSPLRRG
jgi:N-acetylmuramoyl-L-alanine amidase